MSSVFSCLAFLVLCFGMAYATPPSLRVCADPNDMPYSSVQQKGFENQLADMIAKDMGMQVSWFWYPQREAFFRKTLNSGLCDVVLGVPVGMDEAITTRPYYRSGYVFVSRHDRNLHIRSFDDPRLRVLRIGVHVPGGGEGTLPPVNALTSRGIVRNLVAYNIFQDLGEKDPSADLIEAVSNRTVDIAIAWGPVAGYFARQSAVPLDITPITGDTNNPTLPLTFDIAIGVRKGDTALRQRLDAELERRAPEIRQLLRSYGIPQLAMTSPPQEGN